MRIKKHLGQHFLLCNDIIQLIVKSAGNISGKNILEVGPGTGRLTYKILLQNPAKLCSIELDKQFLPYHEDFLLKYKNYELIFDNVLTVKEQEILGRPIIVIANLPYNISTELLFKWLDNLEGFNSFILMFQKEVAERISARCGSKKYGKLSIVAQLLCKVEYLFNISRESFSPQPNVESAVIRMTPYKKPLFEVNIKLLKELIHLLFCRRRKMIHTILKKKYYNAANTLDNLNIDMKLRPEDLSVKQFCDLVNALQ